MTATDDKPWAHPYGVPLTSHPRRYRVRDRRTNEVVVRHTNLAWDPYTLSLHHELAETEQHLGDAAAHLVQLACAYFYAEDADYEPLEGVPSIAVSDDEVRARIWRLEQGENRREAVGSGMRNSRKSEYYRLTELPWETQRALVERLEELRIAWDFEWLDEATDLPAGAKAAPPLTYADPIWEELYGRGADEGVPV